MIQISYCQMAIRRYMDDEGGRGGRALHARPQTASIKKVRVINAGKLCVVEFGSRVLLQIFYFEFFSILRKSTSYAFPNNLLIMDFFPVFSSSE
jgi:hypothetical protein